jgi:membrane fusion protein (multidrug efflux system)
MFKHLVAWLIVLVAIVVTASGLGFYKFNQIQTAIAASASFPEPSESVAAVRAQKGEWSASAQAIGTVVALRQLEVRNEIAGTIAEIGFSSGEVVKQGQLLVQLDVRQEQASLAAAQAEARLAKLTLERRETLRNSPAFSAQELDRARAELAAADARARGLEIAIEKKRITAPFAARIGITDLQPGAYLDAGARLTTLQGVDKDAFIDFSLPQDNAAHIRIGAEVTVSGPMIPGGSARATIVAESESVDRTNRMVQFRAVAKGLGETVRPGMFVDVTAAIMAPQETVMVPLTAVRRSPHGEHVFILVEEEGKLRARQRVVETGPVQNDRIVIRQGLKAGEAIAAAGSFKLRDGLLVNTEIPKLASNDAVTVN